MKARCPKNPKHDLFSTTAHVMQLWIVDQDGGFVALVDESLEVTHRPDPRNIWTCEACGTQAIVGE